MAYTYEDAKHLDFSDIVDPDTPIDPPIHPGRILRNEFLTPLGMSQYRLAKSIGVPQRRIGEIIAGKRSVTADTALRLEKLFGLKAAFWLNLQAGYDLGIAERALAPVLATITPLPREPLAAE